MITADEKFVKGYNKNAMINAFDGDTQAEPSDMITSWGEHYRLGIKFIANMSVMHPEMSPQELVDHCILVLQDEIVHKKDLASYFKTMIKERREGYALDSLDKLKDINKNTASKIPILQSVLCNLDLCDSGKDHKLWERLQKWFNKVPSSERSFRSKYRWIASTELKKPDPKRKSVTQENSQDSTQDGTKKLKASENTEKHEDDISEPDSDIPKDPNAGNIEWTDDESEDGEDGKPKAVSGPNIMGVAHQIDRSNLPATLLVVDGMDLLSKVVTNALPSTSKGVPPVAKKPEVDSDSSDSSSTSSNFDNVLPAAPKPNQRMNQITEVSIEELKSTQLDINDQIVDLCSDYDKTVLKTKGPVRKKSGRGMTFECDDTLWIKTMRWQYSKLRLILSDLENWYDVNLKEKLPKLAVRDQYVLRCAKKCGFLVDNSINGKKDINDCANAWLKSSLDHGTFYDTMLVLETWLGPHTVGNNPIVQKEKFAKVKASIERNLHLDVVKATLNLVFALAADFKEDK